MSELPHPVLPKTKKTKLHHEKLSNFDEPIHKPSVGLCRALFNSCVAHQENAAHAFGRVGKSGGILADAFARPEGYTLGNALVVSQHINEVFSLNMLVRASVANENKLIVPNVFFAEWAGYAKTEKAFYEEDDYETDRESLGDFSGFESCEEDEENKDANVVCEAPKVLISKEKKCSGHWLCNGYELPKCRRKEFEPVEKNKNEYPRRELEKRDVSAWLKENKDLADHMAKYGKQFGNAYSMKMDVGGRGKGQLHSKFCVLHFVSSRGNDSEESFLRLVVLTNNMSCGSWSAVEGFRRMAGLWFYDFKVCGTRSNCNESNFGTTLSEHVCSILGDVRIECTEKIKDILLMTDFKVADDMGVSLVVSEPGTFNAKHKVRGMHSLKKARGAALGTGVRNTNVSLSILVHSCNGWLVKGCVGMTDFLNTIDAGDTRLLWPQDEDSEADISFFKRQLGNHVLLDKIEPAIHTDAALINDGRIHTMLYVWHSEDEIKAVTLGSHNLSSAAWGRFDNADIEIRSFELSVCFPWNQNENKGFVRNESKLPVQIKKIDANNYRDRCTRPKARVEGNFTTMFY